jgi:hypothetical protein
MNEHDEELLDRLMIGDMEDRLNFRATPGSPLAKARSRAHQQFDALWKSGWMTRKKAYRWLARKMGLELDMCHILYFDQDECEKVIQLCRKEVLRRTGE